QLVELVVLADPREGDAVVDLAHLAQGVGGVLRADDDAVLVGEGHERPAAGDALAGVVGPVLHDLLGGDVEGHAHRRSPSVVRMSPEGAVPVSAPPGWVLSRSTSAAKRWAISASSTGSKPPAVMVATVG